MTLFIERACPLWVSSTFHQEIIVKKQLLIPAVVMLALGSGFATLPTTGAFAQAATAVSTT
jgi:hypothetical protein